ARIPPHGNDLVGPLLQREAAFGCGLGHVLAVLVGAGEEPDPVASQAPVPGDHVAGDDLVGMPDVRDVVHVVDRRRDVEGVLRQGPAIVGGVSWADASTPRTVPGYSAARARKFSMIRGPSGVRIDSGWNCTPNRGRVRCRN